MDQDKPKQHIQQIDESEITRLLNSYFWALDDKDFEVGRMQKIFSADAKIVRPNGTAMMGPEMIGKNHREGFARFRSTQHLLSGHDIGTESDNATIRANLVAMHLWADGHGDPSSLDSFFLAGGVITAQVIRTTEGWRVSELANRNIWRTGSGFGSMAKTDK